MRSVTVITFFVLELQLFADGAREIYAEPIYDIHHYRVLHDISGYHSNVPSYLSNKDAKSRGFRPGNGISDEQKAELFYLAANSEPEQRQAVGSEAAPRARPIHWTPPAGPETSTSIPELWTQISYRRYSGKLVNRTRPPPSPNYAWNWNFQTYPPPAYYGPYVPPQQGFIPEGYVPVSTMVSAINKILSIVQKTVRPGSGGGGGAGGGIPEITNFIGTTSGSSTAPTAVIPDQKGTEEELIDAEQVKGTPIRKAEELEKPINSSSFGELRIIGGDGTGGGNQGTSIAILLTTTATSPRPATDDGSNLLQSLLQGRLDKVDWFGSLLGTNQIPTTEEGNAVAQILRGGIFGPAS